MTNEKKELHTSEEQSGHHHAHGALEHTCVNCGFRIWQEVAPDSCPECGTCDKPWADDDDEK